MDVDDIVADLDDSNRKFKTPLCYNVHVLLLCLLFKRGRSVDCL